MNPKELFQAYLDNKEIEYRVELGIWWRLDDLLFEELLEEYAFRLKPKPPRFRVLYQRNPNDFPEVSNAHYGSLSEFALENPKYITLQLLTSQQQ